MGNFYTNVVVCEPNVNRVAGVVKKLTRPAYVAGDGKRTFVFDQACDRQDLDELRRLACELSLRLSCVALAACNHDDDVFWYALAENGTIVDTYVSDPGYFDGNPRAPTGGDTARLCQVFDAASRAADVEMLLRKRRPDVVLEVHRHRELMEMLGLPVELALLGYGYLRQGEPPQRESTMIRALGGAPTPKTQKAPDDALDGVSRMQAPAAEKEMCIAALKLATVKVPTRFVHLFGSESMNGLEALRRVVEYTKAHRIDVSLGGVVDDTLADFLGQREFPLPDLAQLVARAFDVKPLNPE